MKKLLIGTAAAALFVSPAAAGPIAVTVGGYYNIVYQSLDIDKKGLQDGDTAEGTNIDSDAEIIFKGKGKTKNGLTVGFNVQLEAEGNGSSDQIDEHYVYVKGNFGKVTIGAENSAARMLEAGHDKYLGFSQAEDNFTAGLKGKDSDTPANEVKFGYTQTVHTKITGDAQKLTYVSPSFNGLQVGYSMTPSTKDTNGDGFGWAIEGAEYGEATSYGIRYKGKVGPVKLAVSTGAESVDEGDADGGTFEDSSIGLNASYMGFKFSYKDLTRETDAKWSDGADEDTYNNMALSYKVNKQLTVGLDMQSDEDKDGKTTYEHTRFGGTYKLGSGVKLHLSSLDADKGEGADAKANSFTQFGLLMKF